MVFDDIITGTPSQILTPLLRKIGGYTRQDRTKRFKIGITNDPERRFNQAYAGKYNEMIVLYQTDSIDYVSKLEAALIEHNWDLTDNQVGGGGGGIGEPPYYLYVVVLYH